MPSFLRACHFCEKLSINGVDYYANKTYIEDCSCSYWLQLLMHQFRDVVALSLSHNGSHF